MDSILDDMIEDLEQINILIELLEDDGNEAMMGFLLDELGADHPLFLAAEEGFGNPAFRNILPELVEAHLKSLKAEQKVLEVRIKHLKRWLNLKQGKPNPRNGGTGDSKDDDVNPWASYG